MIKIVAKNYLKPGRKQDFINTARELILKSRAEEGNISYSLFQDIHDENVVTFIEEWKDQNAIDIHNSTEHFTRIVPLLGEFCARDGEVNLYEELN